MFFAENHKSRVCHVYLRVALRKASGNKSIFVFFWPIFAVGWLVDGISNFIFYIDYCSLLNFNNILEKLCNYLPFRQQCEKTEANTYCT